MKISAISVSALTIALATSACTKSKSSDPAPQPAPQGAPQPAPQPIPQTPTQVQQQWQQNQQNQTQMPFQVSQQSFTMRMPTSIVGEPNLEVALYPNMKDASGKEVVLPYVDQHIIANGQIAIPAGSKVWGKVRLVAGAQSVFTAGGFVLPNGTQYATTGTGLITSQDILKASWTSAGINSFIGAGTGSAVGLILALTTGDKKVQAWEVLTGTGSGAILGALSSLIWPTSGDKMVSIKADNTLDPVKVYFNVTDATAVPGYKAPIQAPTSTTK
jgi:hypothetical protein